MRRTRLATLATSLALATGLVAAPSVSASNLGQRGIVDDCRDLTRKLDLPDKVADQACDLLHDALHGNGLS